MIIMAAADRKGKATEIRYQGFCMLAIDQAVVGRVG